MVFRKNDLSERFEALKPRIRSSSNGIKDRNMGQPRISDVFPFPLFDILILRSQVCHATYNLSAPVESASALNASKSEALRSSAAMRSA